uniref:Apyrase-like n=1 Tax=Dermatophagoides pteronyssinus TaxID=6956 RepID=A0A6P6YBT6_DERPT|nr:apyrase-like [Dermatophagoides pteronyssinus]
MYVDAPVIGSIAYQGRGMELSELLMWQSKLYAFDDRSGIVYELLLENNNASSTSQKGMKIEWATIFGNDMFIGSFGKEFTMEEGGKILSEDNMLVVKISEATDRLERFDWTNTYEKIRAAVNALSPGYIIHEAVLYRQSSEEWYFLPRRISTELYNVRNDTFKGANKIIILDKHQQTRVVTIPFGSKCKMRGFSSAKFVPGFKEKLIIALRSVENEETAIFQTYLSIFSINGEILLDEVLVSDKYKFEGIEFIM